MTLGDRSYGDLMDDDSSAKLGCERQKVSQCGTVGLADMSYDWFGVGLETGLGSPGCYNTYDAFGPGGGLWGGADRTAITIGTFNLSVATPAALTSEFWFMRRHSITNYQNVFDATHTGGGYWGSGAARMYGTLVLLDNDLRCVCRDGGWAGAGAAYDIPLTDIPAMTPTYVVIAAQRGGTMSVYLNGALHGTVGCGNYNFAILSTSHYLVNQYALGGAPGNGLTGSVFLVRATALHEALLGSADVAANWRSKTVGVYDAVTRNAVRFHECSMARGCRRDFQGQCDVYAHTNITSDFLGNYVDGAGNLIAETGIIGTNSSLGEKAMVIGFRSYGAGYDGPLLDYEQGYGLWMFKDRWGLF